MSVLNAPALGFHGRLGFRQVARTATATDGTVHLARSMRG